MTKFKKSLKLGYALSKLLKFMNFEGTSLPGKLVQRYHPKFVAESNRYIGRPRFAVTGTNGKTTTAGVLSEILQISGMNIINNKLGANMPNGIATALATGLYLNFRDRLKTDGVVLECDEAYYSSIANRFVFDYILVTNLFRDQLDRYGEMDIARKKIIKGIELNPDIKVVLNADDPSLFEIEETLKYNNKTFIHFGFTSVNYVDYEKTSKSPSESLFCPICKAPVFYKKRYYAQLGDWGCVCGASRKKLDVSAKATVYPDRTALDVEYKGEKHKFETTLTGLYNAYNVLGAIACALEINIKPGAIQAGLEEYSPVFGRHQKIKLENGGTLTIHLIKNPVGASEVLRGLKNLQNSRMLIAVNDNYADGRDVSWLWDADFEALSKFQSVIYTTGTRSYDIALRMKYAGFNPVLLEVFENTDKVFYGIEDAINELNDGEDLTVLVTYTGLLEIQKNMKKLISKYGA